jgi:hypothetical protein
MLSNAVKGTNNAKGAFIKPHRLVPPKTKLSRMMEDEWEVILVRRKYSTTERQQLHVKVSIKKETTTNLAPI